MLIFILKPASSKWPFDHFTPEKVTWNPVKANKKTHALSILACPITSKIRIVFKVPCPHSQCRWLPGSRIGIFLPPSTSNPQLEGWILWAREGSMSKSQLLLKKMRWSFLKLKKWKDFIKFGIGSGWFASIACFFQQCVYIYVYIINVNDCLLSYVLFNAVVDFHELVFMYPPGNRHISYPTLGKGKSSKLPWDV